MNSIDHNGQPITEIIPGLLHPSHTLIVIDSTILSHTWHYKNMSPATIWWRSVSRDRLLVPKATLDVIDRGISLVIDKEPEHARELQRWRTDLIETGVQVIDDDIIIHSALSAICSLKPLKGLWLIDSGRRTMFEEVYVVATASTFGAPVATLKARRYLEIAEFYPLPGLQVLTALPWPLPIKKCPSNRKRLTRGQRRQRPKPTDGVPHMRRSPAKYASLGASGYPRIGLPVKRRDSLMLSRTSAQP
jgi:hypothetical protein